MIEIVTKGTLLTTTGQTFEAPCIQVFRIRDGQIHLMRDYFNPIGLTDLLSRSPSSWPELRPTVDVPLPTLRGTQRDIHDRS